MESTEGWQIPGEVLDGTLWLVVEAVLVTQLCPTLCDPMDCSPPDSSIHGIFQARELELVAILYSRGSNLPDLGIKLASLVSPALADRFFTTEPDTTLNKGVLLQGCTQ